MTIGVAGAGVVSTGVFGYMTTGDKGVGVTACDVGVCSTGVGVLGSGVPCRVKASGASTRSASRRDRSADLLRLDCDDDGGAAASIFC